MEKMDKQLQDILILAASLVLTRGGDVSTEDGEVATVDTDTIIKLDYSLAEYFCLSSDDVSFENMDDLVAKIRAL